jgi:S1-C subfamily serine protease
MMVCPKTASKGTGFLLSNGTMVTNEHVVHGCSKDDMFALSAMGTRISFSKIITDARRDLALLRPSEPLKGGLSLGSDVNPPIGTQVTTWGYPLTYNGPAPILSAGYVAGYNAVNTDAGTVKHIIVNGAFNPGNSGGPVFTANEDKVVGIVVWKIFVFSPIVADIIRGFQSPRGVAIGGNFTVQMADGSVKAVSDQEAIGAVLYEFYRTAQVVIGEAISVSELRMFLQSSEKELLSK